MNNKILDIRYCQLGRSDRYMCTILEKLRNKAPKELLDDYGISPEPPIDLPKLLENIGIATIEMDFSEIEDIKKIERGSVLGAVFSNKNDLSIFYKKTDSLHRQKFTIAHELGHCCLHCPQNEVSHIDYRLNEKVLSDKDELQKEREANIFAGKLLIPEKSLKTIYDKMLIPSLKDLADIFEVSTSVMAARLDYLELPYYKDSITTAIL